MKTQQKISGYLQFTRKDRIAVMVIALILLAAFLLPTVLENHVNTAASPADTAWMASIRQLEKPVNGEKEYTRYRNQGENKGDENSVRDRTADRYNNGVEGELFTFDPNSLDEAGWRRLGLRERTIGTIQKYLAKGGRFRQPGDLQKVYGLRAQEYERLKPYIRLERNSPSPSITITKDEKPVRSFSREIKQVEINQGDSTAFESLPGIGPTLAMRIIRFREKLGGFYDVVQVGETFGIADTTFEKIRPFLLLNDVSKIKKIDINKAGLDELKIHPYIKYNIANAIVQYRQHHGSYSSVEELKKIGAIDNAAYNKMYPYFFITR